MTKYTCLACGQWLSFCRCQNPVPSDDETRPLVRAKVWVKAEVAELLRIEASGQEAAAKELVAEHLRTMRKRRN